MALIGQMLGCLLVAAGIGGAVGWLLRHLSAAPTAQRLLDSETELRIKGQALDTALYELKMHTSALEILEDKVSSLESLDRSARQELTSRQERIHALQKDLTDAMQRLSASECGHKTSLQHITEQDAAVAAYADEARRADAARTSAQQELLLKTQEVLEIQQRLADLEGRLAEVDRLRAQVAELEPAQGRVHWLEVQLSEKDAKHRGALHQLKEELAARDHRIAELTRQEQALHDRDRHIAALERRIAELQSLQTELAGHVKMMGEKEEEISRLRKRLVEVRAALRVRGDGGHVVARPNDPANQLSLQIGQSKPSNGPRKDDLKKIHGIGPVIERVLNKMGTYTYIQIAKWTAGDIARVAQKLETNPDRIKRDNWIAGAKKQHREKYGEKI
jgi:predicted flap endonuclease-1-like 5' DNA nuclease